jgi:alpha-amylase
MLKRRAERRFAVEHLEARIVLSDVSPPVILQMFDSSYRNIERRAADVFNAGYGGLYSPPPGRADTSNFSVGYDVYDRFDLGQPGNPTLYGTETGLKAAVSAIHQIGGNYYIDYVANQNGFDDNSTPGFIDAGGYPGFLLTAPFDQWGDFHSPYDTGDILGRLAGLIDIAQEKNYRYVRSPVPGYPDNLPAGTQMSHGRLANVPDDNNRRFYADQSLQPIIVFDPTTGEQNIHIYPFNNATPLNGTPVAENDMGLLMRYAQWLVQTVGVDGFRIDAAKHFERWVLNYFDRAVYRSSFRRQLDGSRPPIFSFSEVYDGNRSFLQTFIRKDINPADPGRVGGNRDVLDFPLYFAIHDNLTNNGLQNDWRNVVGAGMDAQNHGAQGVSFVSNHDVFAPYLGNVAYAYTLMRPGNAIVYFNAKEFGPNRSFPKDGRGDALGGLYGNTITKLLNIRETHPKGNFIQRDLEKEIEIFERDNSLLFAGSNRLDAGYDSRTVHTDFAPGTPLIELTGNAGDPVVDPHHDLPPLLVANGDRTVNLRVPRNRNPDGVEDDRGYVIYGLSGPQGNLSLTNVDHIIRGETPTPTTNGTARLSDIDLVTGNTFQIRLDTNQVNLLGFYRDRPADGDNALFEVDGGVDVTGGGFVDVTPGSVSYGFQNFTDVHSPGYFNPDGNGHYVQTIDASRLSDGMHYVTVRAFRQRADSGPAVFTDFKQAIYIDRSRPVSTVVSFDPIVPGVNENRRLTVRSTDLTADSVHVFFDLPASLTDAQILAMIGSGSQARQIDRDLFTKDVSGVTSGNHVATVVSFRPSGSYNIQRFAGLFASTIFGAGLGDLDFDGQITANDMTLFGQVLASRNSQFNPAADMNGDGLIDNSDLLLLYQRLIDVGADADTFAAYNQMLGPPLAGYTMAVGDSVTLAVNRQDVESPALSFLWDMTNTGTFGDVTGAGTVVTWSQLVSFGINDVGSYPINLQVSDGTNRAVFATNITVVNSSAPSNTGPFAFLFAPFRQTPQLTTAAGGRFGLADAVAFEPAYTEAVTLLFRNDEYRPTLTPSAYRHFPERPSNSSGLNGWLSLLFPLIADEKTATLVADGG